MAAQGWRVISAGSEIQEAKADAVRRTYQAPNLWSAVLDDITTNLRHRLGLNWMPPSPGAVEAAAGAAAALGTILRARYGSHPAASHLSSH